MASQATLKALGLNYSPNNLALPEGSLLVANDVIVRRDNVVESRRGFKDYSEGLGASNEPVKQLLEYKNRILAHYADKIAYDTLEQDLNGQNIFNDFTGTFNETQTGLRIKSIIANKNLYFTSSEGIKKISAKSADDFPNTQIVNSGAVKALDVTVNLDIEQGQLTGFLPVDSAVAYRVLWGYKDANDNLIYGTPSERTLIYNYLSDIIPLDFNTLLNAVDNFDKVVSISGVSIANPTAITTSTKHGLTAGDIVHITGTDTTSITVGSFEVTNVIDEYNFNIPVNVTAVTTGTGQFAKSMISDGNYYETYKLTLNDSIETFKNNVLDFAEKLDKDILYADLGPTNANAPLTIDTVQINVGSIGQVNFAPDQDPTLFFEANDYIEIEGFTSEPYTSSVALTHVGGTALVPENPVSITTSPNDLVNGREISITGTTTVSSVNGTYTATVDERTIISTTGGGTIPSVTVTSGTHSQRTITGTPDLGKVNSVSLLTCENTPTLNIQSIVNDVSVNGSLSVAGSAPYYFIVSTLSNANTDLLQNGDEVYLSNVTGGPNDGKFYVRGIATAFPFRTFNISSTPSGPLLTGSSGYTDGSIDILLPIAKFTLSGGNHSVSSGEYVDIDGCNFTYNGTTPVTIDGNIQVLSATSGTNIYYVKFSGLINSNPSPTYGTSTDCLRFSGGVGLSDGNLIKIVNIASTPSLYTSSTIDNSIELYVKGIDGSNNFYVSYTNGGDRIAVQNASYITPAVSGTCYKAIELQLDTTHNFTAGTLIKIASTVTVPAGLLNDTFKVYSSTSSKIKVLAEGVLTAPGATSGTVTECIQFQSISNGLANGDIIYIGSGFTSTPTLASTQYYVQEVSGDTFYISLLNETPPSLTTSTSVSNTPTIFKEMIIETDTSHNYLQGNWITIWDANTSPSINQTWQISRVIGSVNPTQFGILPTTGASYTPTSGIDVGQVNRITIPVYVNSVTVGTGTVKTTIGKNLTQFNGNYQIVSVVAPTVTDKGYIQFLLPNNPDTFTAIDPDPTKDVNAKIYSYDYRHIVNSPDINYATTLNDLEVSPVPTSEQLRIVQNNIQRIAVKLKQENAGVVQPALISEYLQNYSVTIAGNTVLEITVPEGINDSYFYQVYRTRLFTAEGIQSLGSLGDVPVVPDDEMRLVYEAFPPTPIPTTIELVDTYPEDLALTNENLYTNPLTGQGILQANDTPPFAKDINVFKNSAFFANTKTKQRLNPFQLIGTSNIGGTNNNKITISDGVNPSITYEFTLGVNQITQLVVSGLAATLKTDTQDKYITLSTPVNDYYLWFRYDGAGTDPAPADKKRIIVDINTGDDQNTFALKLNNAIGASALDFTSSVATNTVTVINFDEGICSAPTNTTTGTSLTVTVTVTGDGENAAATPFPKVLLSQVTSRSQAIDLTARSLVRVINKQTTSPVYAFYLSGEDSSPGIINLESKNLTNPQFYVVGCSDNVGSSFTPDISPDNEISGLDCIESGGGYLYKITETAHGLINKDKIIISGSNCDPNIDGIYEVNVLNLDEFTVTGSFPLTTNGSYLSYSKLENASVSTNEEKLNRVYYSKNQQYEAVPILNYFDIGSSDKAILRLMPIRDSLFVFKEDGLYRISGEEIPFVVTLFDSSCIAAAPDSVSISNNIIYAWTVKGISNISESGVSEISRPIDTEILKLASNRYPNFKTATWGVGYDSDNSYTVFTNADPTDQYATIGFRYSDLTSTWTNVKRSQNCGIVFSTDDKLYMAGSNNNIIYQERKNFDRTDYCDTDFNVVVQDGNISNNTNKPNGTRIYFQSVDGISNGDIITQNQILTDYLFNALLQKLDLDPNVGVKNIISSAGSAATVTITTSAGLNLANGQYVTLSDTNSFPTLDGTYQVSNVTSTTFDITVTNYVITQATSGKVKRNYENTLIAETGDSLRTKVVQLAAYLDTDPGLNSSNYSAIVANYSGTILSNSADDPTIITTLSPHGLVNGRLVTITGTLNGSIPEIKDKTYQVTVTGANTFTIPVDVTTSGGLGLSFDTANNQLNILDIQACFNALVDNLNNDTGTKFKNYKTVEDETLLEAVILNVNSINNYIDLNLPLPWTTGIVTIYKAIPCQMVYAPITFDDPLSIKQIYEATLMFDNKAFTKATASFNTDLKPEFLSVDFYGQGNGIFGHYSDPGFGYGFFGGLSNSAPFRTIIPREAQRCRFLTVKFEHTIGREKWALNGITLTGNMGLSSRGYR
jgi:hypothetical protein